MKVPAAKISHEARQVLEETNSQARQSDLQISSRPGQRQRCGAMAMEAESAHWGRLEGLTYRRLPKEYPILYFHLKQGSSIPAG